MNQRTDRVDELLRQEIGAIVAREVSDPRIGFATITNVETTRDLAHAKVWVSVIGSQAERDESIAALDRAMSFVRRELGRRLRLRRIPELHVRLDDTAERGTRVLHLLHELEEGQVPEDEPPVAESLPTPIPRLPQPDDADDLDPAAPAQPSERPRRRRYRPADGRAKGGAGAKGAGAKGPRPKGRR